MNHDYAHCKDYDENCPKECFRGALVRDLAESNYRFPVSFSHLKGAGECMIAQEEDGWHTPEEEMPPAGVRVEMYIELPFGFSMHTTGFFRTEGWSVLANAKDYRVLKWRHFCNHK